MRRAVLVTAAVLLLVEAVMFALIGWVMGLAVRGQQMSIGGLSTDTMAIGTWVGQGLLAAFLLLCAILAARSGLLGEGPRHGAVRRGAGPVVRVLLVGCAVLHGLLGAVLLGVSGVPVFVGLMVVLTVLVLSVMVLREPDDAPAAAPTGTPPSRSDSTLGKGTQPA